MSEVVKRLKHRLTCWFLRRWYRRKFTYPYWREDRVAEMLGVAQYGCRYCGFGSIEEAREAGME